MAAGVLVGLAFAACSSDDDSDPAPAGSAGDSAAGSGEESGGAGAAGTSGSSSVAGAVPAAGGHDSQASAGRGGDAPLGSGGLAGEAASGTSGASGAGGDAGAPVGAAGAAGTPEEPVLPVNQCTGFVDARAVTAPRVIAWDYALGSDPGRCLLVQLGQTVTWAGPLSSHPLQASGGTTPSPIIGDYPAGATSYDVLFSTLGTFGYECGSHTTMRGAIRVVE